jgi:hypothetical protein
VKIQWSSVCKLGAIVAISLAAWAQQSHPILAIGSPALNFELPGIDGAIHKLSDYSESRAGGDLHLQSLPDRADV